MREVIMSEYVNPVSTGVFQSTACHRAFSEAMQALANRPVHGTFCQMSPVTEAAEDFPIHIICYYKETNEVHQSMEAFSPSFNPPLVAVCENVEGPNPVTVLSQYFLGEKLKEGVNIGRHRESGAIFILYQKFKTEPRGKRFSHRIGVDLVRMLFNDQLEGSYALFQDADTQSNPIALRNMMRLAAEEDASQVGASMMVANAFPLSVTGSYTAISEILTTGDRIFETMLFGKTRVVSGSYTLVKLTRYLAFSQALCKPSTEMGLLEKCSYSTEDTLLTHMLSGAGDRSMLVYDEVSWNLPQNFEELLKQRRRWMNGEFATVLTYWPYVARRPETVVFYLWTILFFLKTFFVECNILLIGTIAMAKSGHPEMLWFPALMLALKLFVSTTLFRNNVNGMEQKLALIAHGYCLLNLGLSISCVNYVWSLGYGAVPIIVFLTLNLLQGLRGNASRKLFFLVTYPFYLMYARGLALFLADYAMANLSEISWGTRENRADQEFYKVSPMSGISAVTNASETQKHLAIMMLFQFVLPAVLGALLYAFDTVQTALLCLICFFSVIQIALLFLRLLIGNHTCEVFVAAPIYDLKDRLIYRNNVG